MCEGMILKSSNATEVSQRHLERIVIQIVADNLLLTSWHSLNKHVAME
jgi:hypothetical protein